MTDRPEKREAEELLRRHRMLGLHPKTRKELDEKLTKLIAAGLLAYERMLLDEIVAEPTSEDTAKCSCQNQADEDGAYCPICGKLKGISPAMTALCTAVIEGEVCGRWATHAIHTIGSRKNWHTFKPEPAVTASELDDPETWRGIEKTYEPVTALEKEKK